MDTSNLVPEHIAIEIDVAMNAIGAHQISKLGWVQPRALEEARDGSLWILGNYPRRLSFTWPGQFATSLKEGKIVNGYLVRIPPNAR